MTHPKRTTSLGRVEDRAGQPEPAGAMVDERVDDELEGEQEREADDQGEVDTVPSCHVIGTRGHVTHRRSERQRQPEAHVASWSMGDCQMPDDLLTQSRWNGREPRPSPRTR